MNKNSLRTFATSFTTTLFVVIGISGVMMFFHFNDMYVKELHEVLGLGFFVAVVLHGIVHLKAIKNYLSNKVFIGAAIIVIVASSFFIIEATSKSDGTNPKVLLIESMIKAPISESAVVLGSDYESVKAKLAKEDIEILPEDTMITIGKKANLSPFAIVGMINK